MLRVMLRFVTMRHVTWRPSLGLPTFADQYHQYAWSGKIRGFSDFTIVSVRTQHAGYHYNDVIMGAMASQITSLAIVYSTVYSGTDERNIKALRHWPLCGEFAGDWWIPRTNGQLRGKCFHLMTSSCSPKMRIASIPLSRLIQCQWIDRQPHYSDVIISAMASRIAGVSTVYSTVCSGADQRKQQNSASLASSSQRASNAKMFPYDDVIMHHRRAISPHMQKQE